MRMRVSRSLSLLAVAALSAAGLAAVAGCGTEKDAGGDAEALAQRAREVARAWDGSPAAAAWRAGYHPMGEVVQLPAGGLRSQADRRAYRDGAFVLRGALPASGPRDGRVVRVEGGSLVRPLAGAAEAYEALAGGANGGRPHLTVTGATLGEMRVTTSRGPARVPAWLFTLDGYASPLKQAAALPSPLPRPPIPRSDGLPGHPIGQLVGTTADGRSLTVVALHGACDDGPVVAVLETPGSVVLTGSARERKDPVGLCTKQARTRHVTVRLARPVGDRVVLDAHTGRPVPSRPPYGPSPSWS